MTSMTIRSTRKSKENAGRIGNSGRCFGIPCYRKFFETRHSLKKWAIIALQQSRMLLQSTLLDDPGVFISTGLGGQGLLLQYFCVFFYRVPGDLPSFQQNTLKNEAETAINNAQGCIESTEFKGNYAVMLLLASSE